MKDGTTFSTRFRRWAIGWVSFIFGGLVFLLLILICRFLIGWLLFG